MKRFLIIVGIILLVWLIVAKCSSPSTGPVYVIARDPTWAPMQLLNKETDMLIFSDELLTAIANNQKISIQAISVQGGRLFAELDNMSCDGILTAITPAPQNINKYNLSDPYFLLGPVLIVRNSSSIKSFAQMENKTVGILRESSLVFDIDKYPSVNIIPYDNPVVAIENLIKNNIDGVIMDILPAYSYTNKFYAGQIKVVSSPLTKKGLRLITRKDQDSDILNEHFNNGLEAVKQNGVYDALIKKWDLFNPERSSL